MLKCKFIQFLKQKLHLKTNLFWFSKQFKKRNFCKKLSKNIQISNIYQYFYKTTYLTCKIISKIIAKKMSAFSLTLFILFSVFLVVIKTFSSWNTEFSSIDIRFQNFCHVFKMIWCKEAWNFNIHLNNVISGC